jgi:CubicO group peptidase (beta-lactamase class C family)
MNRLHRSLATLLILCLATAARAYDTAPLSDPEALGFSSSRLARIAAWQQTQVDAGAFSGAVSAIARNGKVAYLRAVGFHDGAKTIPLQPDAIFWIASMTKPVTSVAAMMLVEEGKLDLAAPVHRYLPELKDMMVGVETKDPVTGKTELVLEPQRRAMTVLDLLRHTSGLVHPKQGNTAVHRLNSRMGTRRDRTLAEFVTSIAKLPLAYQPGEVWEYSDWGMDVLARVIEVVSEKPFDQFLESRIFKPLSMIDTGFYVPEAKLARLADPAPGGHYPPYEVTKPTKLFSGAGGLVSTVADYLRFCQMLLNGGELDGVRILSPATIHLMTTNSLPPEVRFAGVNSSYVGPRGGSTWGLGFAIRNDPSWSVVPGSVGSFTWSGLWGTYFWIDPAEQLIAVHMIQVAPGKDGPSINAFRNLTYGAFRVPDQGVVAAAAAPVTVDPTTLAADAGTYRFASTSSRDMQASDRDPRGGIRGFGGLGLDIAMENGQFKVVSPIPNMPAAKAGIVANDVITHLDDEPLQGLTLDQAIGKMRGLLDTRARLKIVRKGQENPVEVSVVRALVRRPGADLEVAVKDGKLLVEANGTLPVLDFAKGAPVAAVPMSSNEFVVDGGDHTRFAFLQDGAGRATSLVLNPGPWQIAGQRIN